MVDWALPSVDPQQNLKNSEFLDWLQSGVEGFRTSAEKVMTSYQMRVRARTLRRAWNRRDNRRKRIVIAEILKTMHTMHESTRRTCSANKNGKRLKSPRTHPGKLTVRREDASVTPTRNNPMAKAPVALDAMAPAMLRRDADKRFTRSNIYERRAAFSMFDTGASTRRIKTLPSLVLSSSRSSWKRRFRVIDLDKVGSTGDADGFQQVCLVTSLRNLGVQLPYTSNGPFKALADGNPMLEPLGKKLTYTRFSELCHGLYVKWHNTHFTAVTISDRVILQDGAAVKEYLTVADIGRADEHLWYRLVDTGNACVHAMPLAKLQQSADTIARNRAVALITRHGKRAAAMHASIHKVDPAMQTTLQPWQEINDIIARNRALARV